MYKKHEMVILESCHLLQSHMQHRVLHIQHDLPKQILLIFNFSDNNTLLLLL